MAVCLAQPTGTRRRCTCHAKPPRLVLVPPPHTRTHTRPRRHVQAQLLGVGKAAVCQQGHQGKGRVQGHGRMRQGQVSAASVPAAPRRLPACASQPPLLPHQAPSEACPPLLGVRVQACRHPVHGPAQPVLHDRRGQAQPRHAVLMSALSRPCLVQPGMDTALRGAIARLWHPFSTVALRKPFSRCSSLRDPFLMAALRDPFLMVALRNPFCSMHSQRTDEDGSAATAQSRRSQGVYVLGKPYCIKRSWVLWMRGWGGGGMVLCIMAAPWMGGGA